MTETGPIEMLMWAAQHRGGSEVQAGGRALLNPSPLHNALSSNTGRMLARTMVVLGLPQSAQNFVGARIPIILHLAQSHIPPDRTMPTTVDAFASYSTIGYDLAWAYPGGLHIDFAAPDLVKDIRARLERSGVIPPPNYQLRAVNYKEQSILQALGRKVDVVIANSTYYTWDENLVVLKHLRRALRPGGVVLTSMAFIPAVMEVQRALRFFKSQIGQFPLTMRTEAQAEKLMLASGFDTAHIYRASALVEQLGLPSPILDLELFAVGRVS